MQAVPPLLYLINADIRDRFLVRANFVYEPLCPPLPDRPMMIDHLTQLTHAQAPAVAISAAGIFSTATGTNVRATLMNTNAPETRGTAFAIFNLVDDLGKGLGPEARQCSLRVAQLTRSTTGRCASV